MFRRFATIAFICIYTTNLFSQTNQTVKGEIILQLFKGNDIEYAIQSAEKQFNVTLEAKKALSASLNIWLVQFDPEHISGEQLVEMLIRQPEIANVQLNHFVQNRSIPDDTFFSEQWNMLNDGSDGGIADADIDADDAWNISTGGLTIAGDTIVIAIVDDGFFLAHEDLSFFKNYNEIPGNLIDDDANGYVDDFDGWNSTDLNGTILSKNHGTHVSGIAGAIGDNGIGVAGVNWHVKLLPVKCDVIESEVIASYAYIYDMRALYNTSDGAKGAFIVATNSSFGIDFVSAGDFPVWCAMYDSLGTLGILSAAATNNSVVNIDVVGDMPTGCSSDFLIAVTNTDQADNLKAGYGAVAVDLGAPGNMIESTYPDNTYGKLPGTSMASPHVAGTVALMFSAACEKFMNDYAYDPAAMALLVKDYILTGTDFCGDLNGISVSNGRLNVNNAMLKLVNGYCSDAIDSEIPESSNLVLFPNPAGTILNIHSAIHAHHELKIMVYDELMRPCFFSDLKINTSLPEINVSDFLNGIYFLKLADKTTGTIYTSTFVVQH